MVEDSLAGIISAKAAGMWAVGITHTYNAAQLRQSGADAIIHGLETLTPSGSTSISPLIPAQAGKLPDAVSLLAI